jgi:hypothetical protein
MEKFANHTVTYNMFVYILLTKEDTWTHITPNGHKKKTRNSCWSEIANTAIT